LEDGKFPVAGPSAVIPDHTMGNIEKQPHARLTPLKIFWQLHFRGA